MLTTQFYPLQILYCNVLSEDSWYFHGRKHGGYILGAQEAWNWTVLQRIDKVNPLRHGETRLSVSYTSNFQVLGHLHSSLINESTRTRDIDFPWFRTLSNSHSSPSTWKGITRIPREGCSLDEALERIFTAISKHISSYAESASILNEKPITLQEQQRIQTYVYNSCMAHVPRDLIRPHCEPLLKGGDSC
jgi:hypothetical protein